MLANFVFGGRRAAPRSGSLGDVINIVRREQKTRSPLPGIFRKMKSTGRDRRSSCPEAAMNAVGALDHLDELPWGSVDNLRANTLPRQDSLADPAAPQNKERRHKKWNRRLLNFKDEVEKAYSRIKSSVPSFREGCETLKARLSPSRDLETTNSRTLHVEVQTQKRRGPSLEDLLDDELEEQENVNNVCQPSLIVQNLADGQFQGLIQLRHLPCDGDIIVRIGDSKLEFFLHKKVIASRDNHHTIHRPYKVGELDLPIFIDSMTLQFSLEDDTSISLEGCTKNFLSRRLSVSTDDIRMKLKHPRFQKKGGLSPLSGRSPVVKKKVSPRKTIWYAQLGGAAGDGSLPMRDRAYTR